MTANTFTANTDIGGASNSAPQTRVFKSRYGYTVKYQGFGIYLFIGKNGKRVVHHGLQPILDAVEVVFGEEEARELARVMNQ